MQPDGARSIPKEGVEPAPRVKTSSLRTEVPLFDSSRPFSVERNSVAYPAIADCQVWYVVPSEFKLTLRRHELSPRVNDSGETTYVSSYAFGIEQAPAPANLSPPACEDGRPAHFVPLPLDARMISVTELDERVARADVGLFVNELLQGTELHLHADATQPTLEPALNRWLSTTKTKLFDAALSFRVSGGTMSMSRPVSVAPHDDYLRPDFETDELLRCARRNYEEARWLAPATARMIPVHRACLGVK
jgi:hypothetical protein